MNQNLKLRIMTALVGVPLILLLLTGMGIEGVAFFSWLISIGMLYEYSRLFFTLEDSSMKTFILLFLNTLMHVLNYWIGINLNSAFVGLMPMFTLFIVFLFMVPKLLNYEGSAALATEEGAKKLSVHFQELVFSCFGMVYAGWLPMLMVNIYRAPQGDHWVIFTMLVVWSADTFAYFGGKYFGKRLFYETISPKKTWEGAIAGSLGALMVSLIYAVVFINGISFIQIGVMSLTIGIASMLGDLCESMMKRAANVKDSGSILPGHGGFLDRFDGVVFALPVMNAFVWLLS